MLNKNYLSQNRHLTAEVAGDFGERLVKAHPEWAEKVARLKELLPPEVYELAFSRIQTFNVSADRLLIVSGGIRQRTFLERDCIPALKEAFQVSKVQIIG